MENVIEFTNVGKMFPEEKRPALSNVSFSVGKGEFVCLIGASGCGKTTTLKLIAGLEEATSGTIVKPPNVAMAFQQGALFPWLTVFENVALGLRQRGAGESEISRTVERELRAMNMHAYQAKYPSDLSGGQRQRVGIARALAVDPVVLLLDEPFSALDPKTTAELHDDLIAIWQQTKRTIVMVSHVIEEAVSLADRIILMRDGAVDEVFPVDLPYPRRESDGFHRDVMKIRRAFFK
jgi:NitT/TauT family transport system ATP-binding protein